MVRRVLVLSIAALLAGVPAASAAWGAKGTWEPDTRRDVVEGWMHRDPDTSKVVDPPVATTKRNVYFNGFHGDYSGSMSPNLGGAVKSSIYHGASYSFYAMLGVWKDCNKDGYVGIGEHGVWEYRNELLLDKSVCPVQSNPTFSPATGKPPKDWYPSHNDGLWVREWLSIAWYDHSSVTGDVQPWDINDNGSRVWADYGLPEKAQVPSLNCWFIPHPTGTYDSTGAMLEYLSCYDGWTASNAWNSVAPDNTVAGQLSFKDNPDDQSESKSKLNVENPWGHANDSPYFQMWSCGPRLVSQQVVVNNDTQPWVNASAPKAPSTPNMNGRPGGQLNETGQGFQECDRQSGNTGSTAGEAPYYLEGDVLQSRVKVQPDVTMAPRWNPRPSSPWQGPLGKSSPEGPDLGTRLTSSDGFWSESVSRDEVPLLDSRGQVTTTWHNTFYAYVSPSAISAYKLTMPKGPTATGTYGFEACGASAGVVGAPDLNGWACNPTKWWKDVHGNDIEPVSVRLGDEVPFSARAGSPFNLRDIDCYDQNVGPTRAAGIGPHLATGPACVR